MSISADHEHQEPRISAQLAADVLARLTDLDTVSSGEAEALETPRDYLNRASELMCGDNPHGALDTLLTGWAGVERRRRTAPEEIPDSLVLEYMAALVDRAIHVRDMPLAEEWAARRAAFLEDIGRPRQAVWERALGLTAFREPGEDDWEDIESLAAGTDPDDLEALDLRILWGVALSRQGRHTEAIAVLEAARDLCHDLGSPEGEVLALFLVEDSYVQLGDEETSLEHIHWIVRTTDNRAILGMVLMKRARLSMGTPSKNTATVYDLLHALEIFTHCGIRSGALMAAMGLAQLLHETGAPDASIAAYEVALDHAERSESSSLPAVIATLANAYVEAGRHSDAAPLLRRFLDSVEPVDGSQAAERAAALGTLGHAYLGMDETEQAEKTWAAAYERFIEQEDGPAASTTAGNLGKLAFADSRLEEAKDWVQKALEAGQRHGLHPLQASEHMIFLASVLAKEKDETALTVVEEALSLADHFDAAYHRAQYLEMRAVVLYDLDRIDEAIAATLLAGDAYADVSVPDEGTRCDIRAADLLRHRERFVEAVSVYRSAIDRDGERPEYLFAAFHGLSQALTGLGQDGEARAAAEEAALWKERALREGYVLD